MKENFLAAMKIELTFEGGKDDDPVDPGGRTNQGIIQREYTAYRLRKKLPNRDVFLMENDERDEIYHTQYGLKVKFDELPPGVDLVILDGAINSGVSQCIKWVQRALNITADGVLGEVTMQRIEDHPDHDALIAGIIQRREAFLKQLKTFYRFGKGWIARTQLLKKKGQAWAMGSVGPTVVYISDGHKKAKLADAKLPPQRAIADATASGGVVSSSLGTAQQAFAPIEDTHFGHGIIMALTVAGVALAVIGVLWGIYARRKKAELEDALDTNPHALGDASNDNVPQEIFEQFVNRADQGKSDASDPHARDAA